MIKLSFRNGKLVKAGKELGVRQAAWGLLAGHSCPVAGVCKGYVSEYRKDGKVSRKVTVPAGSAGYCYVLKSERQYPDLYRNHKNNFKATMNPVKFQKSMIKLIAETFKDKVGIFRIHDSGDFHSFEYLRAWISIAAHFPRIRFFFYTKQASYLRWYKANSIPNLAGVFSHGSLLDSYAAAHGLNTCYIIAADEDGVDWVISANNGAKVLYNPALHGPILCENTESDDIDAIFSGISFSLRLH